MNQDIVTVPEENADPALAAKVAHEMNNSLALIKVKTYLLKRNARAGKLRAQDLEENLEALSALADRIGQLVSELRSCAENKNQEDPISSPSDQP